MTAHNTEAAELLKELSSDAQIGLSKAAAEEKLSVHGENKLKEKPKKTTLQRFVDQFKDAMILILIAAAAVSFAIACIEGNPREFFEPALILAIVIINAIMGVMQESKAEKPLMRSRVFPLPTQGLSATAKSR